LSPLLSAVALASLFGLALGSFLNVCVARWPVGESVVQPRSRCPVCHIAIRPLDNIPVVSWLCLRGRCRGCQASISIQYPLVELATAVLWGAMVWVVGVEWEALRGAVFLTLLLGIALSDAQAYIIPDPFSVGGAFLGVALSLTPGGLGLGGSLSGAALGFGGLWLVGWVGTRALGKPALGGGDVKMMAMVGAFTGATGALLTVFLGSVLGVLLFAPVALRRGVPVPFGVFLALGGAVTWFAGERLVAAYMGWAFGVAGP
jgi:leader peptidase (prepilin peptidase)/N-methyltransferase